MNRSFSTRLCRVLATIGLAAAALTAPVALSAQAAPAFCSLPASGLTVFTFTGSVSTDWFTDGNWSLSGGQPPRFPGVGDAATAYVCIPASKTVVVTNPPPDTPGVPQATPWVNVQMLDNAGRLTVASGARLYVHGAPATRQTWLRQGSTTVLDRSAAIGGSGEWVLEGALSANGTSGTPALTTRHCALYAIGDTSGQDCIAQGAPFPAQSGHLLVNDTGVFTLNRSLNVFDRYRITVRGVVRIKGLQDTTSGRPTLIAADPGTRFELRPKVTSSGKGLLDIKNDGGYHIGRLGRPIDPTTLSAFVNGGTVKKSGGSGTAVIDADYSRVGTGAVVVQSGTLSLPPGTNQAATVSASDAVGFGTCAPDVLPCVPVQNGDDLQAGTLRISTGDASGAQQTTVQLDGAGPTSTTMGQKVHATTANLTATLTDPATLTLRYDASLRGSETPANVVVQRQPEAGGAWATVSASCVGGQIPAGSTSCVDRVASAAATSAAAGGDLVVVVRTTQFSRWVALRRTT